MYFTVVNTKGGVGKTLISQQILVPFLNWKKGNNEKVELVEIDNNNESNTLTDSNIMTLRSIDTKEGEDVIKDRFFDILSENVDLVIDAGGGNDTKEVLKAMKEMQITDEAIFFIPVIKTQANIKNIADTYTQIRTSNTEAKIVFLLNMFTTKEDFIYFYGDSKLNIDGFYRVVKEDPNAIVLKLPASRIFDLVEYKNKQTVYEVGKLEIDTKQYLKDIIANKNKDKYKKELAYIEMYKEARAFYLEVLEPIFKAINKLVK